MPAKEPSLEGIKFGRNYHQNLALLLKAGLNLSVANSMASQIKIIEDEKAKKQFIEKVESELNSYNLI